MLDFFIVVLETIVYLTWYLFVFPLLVMVVFMILYFFFLLIFNREKLEIKEVEDEELNKSNKVEINGKFVLILILIWSIFIFISNNVTLVMMDDASVIDYEKQSDLNCLISKFKDLINKETIKLYVYTNNIEIDYSGEKAHLILDEGKYIIPIGVVDSYTISSVLKNDRYGEQLYILNEIEVYKNTKYIKSINGIDLD